MMPAQVRLESSEVGVRVEQVDIEYQRCFSVGTIFAAKVACTGGYLSVNIPAGASLTITTVNYVGRVESATLYINSDEELPLCCIQKGSTVTGLGLTWIGPQQFQLKASGAHVNLFGSVSPATYEYKKLPIVEDTQQHAEKDPLLENVSSDTKRESKKRRMSDCERPRQTSSTAKEEEPIEEEKESQEAAPESNHIEEDQAPQLSKKQRKRLAKQKAKEIAEAVAFLNQHKPNAGSLAESKSGTKKVVLTNERRLPGGVLVRDIVVGSGTTVKLGRNVSILYEGAFPTGKVFDRNKNRNNPLMFRLGTGEVIKGLEKGMEGMKVGGEREITIPPELGYGKKGSGNVVPPNSTLVFSVQLVRLGD
jgi:FKBP-type peptidyl-prolyl cis-trans isomerase